MAGLDVYALLERSFHDMRLPPTPPDEHVKSGLCTPPNRQELPTPDMTPPGALMPPRPSLSQYPSSRAESFRTAPEEPLRSPVNGMLAEVESLWRQVGIDQRRQYEQASSPLRNSTPSPRPHWDAPQTEERLARRSLGLRGNGLPRAAEGSAGQNRHVSDTQMEDPGLTRERRSQWDVSGDGSDELREHDTSRNAGESPQVLSVMNGAVMVENKNVRRSNDRNTREMDSDIRPSNVGGGNTLPRSRKETNNRESVGKVRLPSPPIDRSRGQSSWEQRQAERNDWEKHVSYILEGEYDEGSSDVVDANVLPLSPSRDIDIAHLRTRSDRLLTPPEKAARAREAREAGRQSFSRGDAAEGASVSSEVDSGFVSSTRETNDLVYKMIQDDNMNRFEALDDGRAIEAEIVPLPSPRTHALKRIRKRHSLRADSDSDAGSSVDGRSVDGSPTVPVSQPYFSPFRPQENPLLQPVVAGTRAVSMGSPVNRLRHERRPLSASGRPTESANSPRSVSGVTRSSNLLQVPPVFERAQPRQTSLPIHLGGDGKATSAFDFDSMKHELRRSSRDSRIEHNSTDVEQTFASNNELAPYLATSPTAPSFLGHNPGFRGAALAKSSTPLSISAWSDRMDVEVCEAKNVAIFPHSNESVLVVQHGSRPASQGNLLTSDLPRPSSSPKPNNHLGITDEQLRASPIGLRIDPPAPSIALNGNAIDSPLTNPREAPQPPVIKFIPPTPNDEADRQLGMPDIATTQDSEVQRRPSLASRARRYSDNLIQPLLPRALSKRSRNIRRPETAPEKYNDKLHPMWTPNNMWEDEYSDDEGDYEPLPRGGDTSEHPCSLFPRSMSVRMPGFRGTGGFLIGNSVGMDRHGTNKRRHFVDVAPSSQPTIRHFASNESLRQMAGGSSKQGRHAFRIPGTRTRVQFVGLRGFRERMSALRRAKEEHAREKRRLQMKDQIRMRIVHLN